MPLLTYYFCISSLNLLMLSNTNWQLLLTHQNGISMVEKEGGKELQGLALTSKWVGHGVDQRWIFSGQLHQFPLKDQQLSLLLGDRLQKILQRRMREDKSYQKSPWKKFSLVSVY